MSKWIELNGNNGMAAWNCDQMIRYQICDVANNNRSPGLVEVWFCDGSYYTFQLTEQVDVDNLKQHLHDLTSPGTRR